MSLYCTFVLDDTLLGLPAVLVDEITRGFSADPVPLAPHMVEGLINLRGRVITALDLRHILSLPCCDKRPTDRHVIVSHDDDTYSFRVDKIGDIVEVDERNFDTQAGAVPSNFAGFAVGAYQLPDQLLMVLKLDALVVVDTGSASA
jgi:purine-binding chemotaxis protein CheW